jgi:hypothetical protein
MNNVKLYLEKLEMSTKNMMRNSEKKDNNLRRKLMD